MPSVRAVVSNVTVSIVTYTALEQSKRCIQSVLEGGGEPKLILTANDNLEAEAFFQKIASEHPNVTVVTYPRNAGFIEPNRHALTLCDTEYMVLLNDDAVVPDGWLAALEQPFKDVPTAAISGAIGCALRDNLIGYESDNVEYIEMSCAMVKTTIARRHGLFSPYLVGAYCEDTDFSLRMREQGYTIHRVPLQIKHERFATSKKVTEAKAWFSHNIAVMQKRWKHYIKVRRVDYPIVLCSENCLDTLLTPSVLIAIKGSRPLSLLYVETDNPEMFTGMLTIVENAAVTIPVMKDELRVKLSAVLNEQPSTKPKGSLLPGPHIEKRGHLPGPSVTLLYVYVIGNTKYHQMAAHFAQTYRMHLPDYPHSTLIVCNGGTPNSKAMDCFARLQNVRFISHDNSGHDIGAYIAGAKHAKTDMIVCCGSHCYFNKHGWLKRMAEAWEKHGPGMYGTFASYEVRPHLNTFNFWCSPEFLTRYPHQVTTKADRYAFEHDGEPLWQMVAADGYPVKLVTWDGEYDWQDWRKPDEIFRRGNQTNCLLASRLSRDYQIASPRDKKILEQRADVLTMPNFEP